MPDLPPTPGTTPTTDGRFWGQTAAFYAQDLMQLAPQWKLMLGARFDNFKQTLDQRLVGKPDLGRVDNKWSPRAGLLYQPTIWSTLYLSYSRNFDPSGESLNLAANNAELAPERTQNYEGGAKFSSFGDKLISTVAVYDLDRNNIKTPNPANPSELLLTGEQRTLGASLSFQGSVTQRWMVYGGYAYQDAVVTKSNASFNGISFQGKRPTDIPLHSGSIWSTYRFANGLGAGGGVYFNTDSFAFTDNLVRTAGLRAAGCDGVLSPAAYRDRRAPVQPGEHALLRLIALGPGAVSGSADQRDGDGALPLLTWDSAAPLLNGFSMKSLFIPAV